MAKNKSFPALEESSPSSLRRVYIGEVHSRSFPVPHEDDTLGRITAGFKNPTTHQTVVINNTFAGVLHHYGLIRPEDDELATFFGFEGQDTTQSSSNLEG